MGIEGNAPAPNFTPEAWQRGFAEELAVSAAQLHRMGEECVRWGARATVPDDGGGDAFVKIQLGEADAPEFAEAAALLVGELEGLEVEVGEFEGVEAHVLLNRVEALRSLGRAIMEVQNNASMLGEESGDRLWAIAEDRYSAVHRATTACEEAFERARFNH